VVFALGLGFWLLALAASFVWSRWRPARSRHADRVAVSIYWVALVAAVTAGIAPLVPPGVDENPEPTAFSVARAHEHIVAVARQPHPMGSAAIVEVREYIASQLRGLGLDPEFQAVSAPDYYGGSNATLPVVNVIARIEGTAPTGSVALVAHFDTVPSTPGANDNASGVAVVLETARSLLAAGGLRNDVILLFTDGEEPAPKYGSTAFVADHRWSDEIRFVINLEAIGTDGPSLLTEMNGPHRWILDRYVGSASHPAAFSFLTEITELIGGSNTDFAPFRDAGIPGVEFVYAQGSSIYHTAADTPDRVSSRSLQAHGANTLALARDLAQTDFSSVSGDDEMIFFTVGRSHVVRYPTSWAVPLVVLAGVALVGAVQRRTKWLAVAGGALLALVIAVSIAAVVAVLWFFLAGWRNSMGVAESYAYLFGSAALVATVMVIPFPSRPGIGMKIQPEAAILVWWVLALLTAITVPGMSYLFALPALTGALALWVGHGTDNRSLLPGAAIVTMGTAAVVLVPAIDTFFQFAQPRPGNPDSEILATIAVPVLLIALGTELALSFRVNSSAEGQQ
jgi:hypothetical protein